MWRAVAASLILGLALGPAPARANAPEAPSAPGAPEPETSSDQTPPASPDEVIRSVRDEIAALLTAHEIEPDAAPPEPVAPPRVRDEPPASMTSRLPAAAATRAQSSVDLRWLEGLVLPDFPVRWDDRLVRMLERYRDDPRAHALLRTLLAREGRYGAMLRAKLRAAKLPEDLVYVAMVESAYDPTARSEVGALGIWQFMTAPASEYGLEVSRWIDMRMAPEAATDAAVRYFEDLYARLGTWPLAMAAFNMGYGALSRSIQKYNSNDFWMLSNLEAGLPYETILYVTKITAYAIIAKNKARFGYGDLSLDAPIDTVRVDLPGGVSLARVARALGVDAATVAGWNPELKKARLPPDVKTWALRIPKDRAARFREKWPSHEPAADTHAKHTLRLGECLSDVADAYQTTVRKLVALNDIEDPKAIRAGTTLRVPDVQPATPQKPDMPTVGVPGDAFLYVDRARVFYRVAEGDTLQEIAGFFGISTDEIRMWNQVALDAKLQRGMYLQLFVPKAEDLSQALVLTPEQVRTLVVGTEEFFEFHEAQQHRVRIRYRVKPGDTLRSLAERFELSVGSIARINQFSRDKQLDPSSEIIVYVPEATAKRLRVD